MSIRVRFAPSPTGFLHIGGARTALFNWIYARHTGGTFVLRIEDTDGARNSLEAVDVILQGLKWLGLDWDEGPASSDARGPSRGELGPYFQSQRQSIYERRVAELKEKDLAYDHDGAVKFRMPREPIIIPDLVVGQVRRELTDREEQDPDFVIVRSDGQPVFHLVNVIDDLEMKITHVIRGEDHLSNTSKHIALFQAFGVKPPAYAHIPLILNSDGSKMSKRDTGASLNSYMAEGFVPEAVVNYLCLLGWSPKENRELVPLDQVIELFDLSQILRHNARFDMTKLQWMNIEYIKKMSADRFQAWALPELRKAGLPVDSFAPDYVAASLATCQEKVKQLADVPAFTRFYFQDTIELNDELKKEFSPEAKNRLREVQTAFDALPKFDAQGLEAAMKTLVGRLGLKLGPLVHPTRLACTGSSVGPSLYLLMEVLGKERVQQRLAAAIAS